MGLEEDRLDMGGRMLHPKPSIQLLSVLMLLQNDMDAAKFKVFLPQGIPALVERKPNELQLVRLSDEIARF